jgi:hypothetical protein
LEPWLVEEIVRSLEGANLVRRSSDPQDVGAIEHEVTEKSDEDVVAGELLVAVTELGLQTVGRWLSRTRLRFGSWPPERPDVDDGVG